MRISTTTHLLVQRFGSLTTAVQMLADAGFDCYDFSVFDTSERNPLYTENWRAHIAEVKAAADKAGIACNQSHAPFPSSQPDIPKNADYNAHIFDRIVRAMEGAALLGAKNIIVHPVQHLNYHALKMIERNKGIVTDKEVTIKCQKPKAVRYEQSFPGLAPAERLPIGKTLSEAYTFSADCAGLLINGYVKGKKDYVAELEATLDGGKPERFTMPVSYRHRRLDIYWNFELKPGNHSVTLRWLNPVEGATINVVDAVTYKKTGKEPT